MFGENLIIKPKTTPKKPVSKPGRARFAFIRSFTDRFYRDPYKWSLMKCVAFFAASVMVARTLSELDILPADAPTPSPPSIQQAAY